MRVVAGLLLSLLVCVEAQAQYTDSGIHDIKLTSGLPNSSTNPTILVGTSVGQLVVVGVAWDRAGITPNTVVTDTSSGCNTYTKLTDVYLSPEYSGLFYSVLACGGTLNISATANSSNSAEFNIAARAFNNPAATPASGTPATATGVSTAPDTGTFTPADSNALYVAMLAANTTSATTESQSPGDMDWALSDEQNTSSSGSFVFKIINDGSTPTRRSVWSLGASAGWAVSIGGFKSTATVTCAPSLALLGVGRCGE